MAKNTKSTVESAEVVEKVVVPTENAMRQAGLVMLRFNAGQTDALMRGIGNPPAETIALLQSGERGRVRPYAHDGTLVLFQSKEAALATYAWALGLAQSGAGGWAVSGARAMHGRMLGSQLPTAEHAALPVYVPPTKTPKTKTAKAEAAPEAEAVAS